MDEFLPSEMFAKIASNLSYKDVNSLLRTSKTAHAKLTPYRNILPKIPLVLLLKRQSNEVNDWWWTTARLQDPGNDLADEFTDEASRARVVSFYKSKRIGSDRVADQIFNGRVWMWMSLHIQAILIFADIKDILMLDVEDNQLCEELTRLIKQSRSRIVKLEIETTSFLPSHLDVLSACEPRFLKIRKAIHLPNEFYKLPAVLSLTELTDLSREKTVHNVCSLTARRIRIRGRHNITINDVQQIIGQWAMAKRELLSFSLALDDTLNEEAFRVMLEHFELESQLVDVEPDHRREKGWILSRRCDSVKLSLHLQDNILSIYYYIG